MNEEERKLETRIIEEEHATNENHITNGICGAFVVLYKNVVIFFSPKMDEKPPKK